MTSIPQGVPTSEKWAYEAKKLAGALGRLKSQAGIS
jgi:hypothetical protein